MRIKEFTACPFCGGEAAANHGKLYRSMQTGGVRCGAVEATITRERLEGAKEKLDAAPNP